MRPAKAIVLLSVSAIIGLTPYMARAVYCCDPWGAVGQAAFVQAGTGVVSAVETLATTVSNYLDQTITQTINNGFARWADELNKGSANSRLVVQGGIQAQAQLSIQGKKVEAEQSFAEASMLDQTVTNGLMINEQHMRNREQRQSEGLALSEAMRPTTGAMTGPASRHAEFCGPRAMAVGLCAILAPTSLQDADTTVNTILNPGDGQYETLSDEEVRAGRAFIQNIVKPLDTRAMTTQTPQGKHLDSLQLADQAALSLAANSLSARMLNRVRKGEGKSQ